MKENTDKHKQSIIDLQLDRGSRTFMNKSMKNLNSARDSIISNYNNNRD